jgi:S-methylmethionine-dependent homocysteine/selenocysteine methylase
MNNLTILDGGMGKELRRIGAPFRQPEWSALALIEAPEFVVQAHTNFIEAGAQTVITNNYAVVPYHLGDDVVAERGAALTRTAGELARQAADAAAHPVSVAGSLPPLFGSYEPEHFDADRAPALYSMIAASLAPFVDLWVAETLSLVAELEVIVEAVRQHGTGQHLWASFALPDHYVDHAANTGGAHIALRSGDTIDDIVAAVGRHRDVVDAVLFNCSLPEQIGPALAELTTKLAAAGIDVRTGAYANAFPDAHDEGYAANNVIYERREDLTTEAYADIVDSWVAGGATIIGGCCDMYPEHIAELARRHAPATAG